MPDIVPIDQLKFDPPGTIPGVMPIESVKYDKGLVDRAGDIATDLWSRATSVVDRVSKVTKADVPVDDIRTPDAMGMVPLTGPELKAAAISVATFPGDLAASSIAGLTGITELATGGGLERAGKTIEKTTAALSPSAAVQPLISPETQAAQQQQMAAVGAIIPPGGVVAQAGEALGMDEKYAPLVEAAVNIAAIGGPTAYAIGKPAVLNSNWYRKLTIQERGLVLSTVDQLKASGMTDGEIARLRPEFWQEAFKARGPESIKSTAETATTAPTLPSQPGLPPGPIPPARLALPGQAGPSPVPMPERFPIKPGVDFQETWPTPPSRALPEASGLGIWNQATGGRPGTIINPNLPVKGGPGKAWVAPPSNLPPVKPATPPTPPLGAPITPEAIPTPPGRAAVATAPPAAPEVAKPVPTVPAEAPPADRIAEIDRELADLDAKYKEKLAKQDMRVPPPIRKELLDGIAKKMDVLDSEKAKLSTGIPQAEPPVQTPGQKFANVRDIKSKQKKEATEPTLQQRILRAGGIKIDPAMRGEFAQYGLRQGEGALARLYRSEKHPGHKRARGWDQWVETLIEDGTLREGAGITDLFEAIKKNKRPGIEIADQEFAKSSAESAAKTARETVPENEIALGDSFHIDGEKFKAVRYDERGNLIVKDGHEKVVEANTGLQVDGGKDGVTPGEIPKVAEEAPKSQPFKLDTEEAPAAETPLKPESAGEQPEIPGMEGQRAKYRAPEKAPPAPPPEGGLFGNEKGSVDLSPLIPMIEAGREIKTGLKRLFLPTSISPEHLTAAEILSHKEGRANRRRSIAKNMLKAERKMFDKLGVHKKGWKGMDNPGHKFASDMFTGRKMTPEMQKIADKAISLLQSRINLLEAAGAPLGKVRDHYFPGMWKDKTAAERFLSKRPFKGGESFRKAKTFVNDWMEGIDAGLEPISDNPIDMILYKLEEMDRSIMANEALREYEGRGDIVFKSISKKMPEGFKHIDDKYGTVYGPSHITVEEYIDEHQYNGLLKVAGSLGIKHERRINTGAGTLGKAWPGGKITTQFATEINVLAHETGHQLDFKYDLWDKIVLKAEGLGKKGEVTKTASAKKRGVIQKELRALADLTWEGQPTSSYYKAKVRKQAEKMAHLLEAYIHAPERFRDVAPTVYDSFNSFLRSMPELQEFTKIKPGLSLTKLENEKSLAGPVLMGHRVARIPTADILNNYLSKTLYNNPYFGLLYKGVMFTGNLLNQTQLGVGSFFHAGFTAGEVQISAGADILQDLYGVARGNRSFRQLGRSVVNWPTAIFTSPRDGAKLMKEWNEPGTQGFKMTQIAEAMELAGAGLQMEKGLRTNQTEAMLRDWYSQRKVIAAIRTPVVLIEVLAKPVMDWLVPLQKAFVFSEMAGRIIEQNPGVPLPQLRNQFRQAWNDVDQRLGQVLYNRIFINNAAKNVIQGLIRAPGWTGGTIGQIGGAPIDAYRFFKEWKQAGKAPPEMPRKVAYTVSLLLTTAMLNGLLTYAFTGEDPDGIDWWAFRDGGTDEYGKPTRFLLPTYAKDVYSWYKKPRHTAVAKVHPAISTELEIQRGTDFYGTQIANPEDSWISQQASNMKHRAKAFVPFWMRGTAKVVEREGGWKEAAKSPLKAIAPLVGVMPATAAYTRTEAERLMGEMGQAHRPMGGSSPGEADYAKLRARTLRLLRLGKKYEEFPADMREALDKIPENKLNLIEKEAETTWLSSRFNRRTVEEKIQVWKVMNPKERAEVADAFWTAIDKHYDAMDDDDPEKEMFKQKVERADMAVEKAK